MHKNLFLELSIQESIVNVNLLDCPAPGNSEGENRVNCWFLNHQAKCFKEVHSRDLLEPFGNQSGFVFVKRPIKKEFDVKDPHTVDFSHGFIEGNKIPSVVYH